MPDSPSCLIFDLDGTLSDPGEGIYNCFCHTMKVHGYPVPERTFINSLVGPPLDEGFRACIPGVSSEHVIELVKTYRERYFVTGYAENALYPGIAAALSALHERGIDMGVCTSKKIEPTQMILKLFGLDKYFRFVSGGDIGIRKSQQLAELLAQGYINTSALMIGDRAVDIEAARENGLKGAGVLWGYGSEDELRGAGASRLMSEPEELPALVAF